MLTVDTRHQVVSTWAPEADDVAGAATVAEVGGRSTPEVVDAPGAASVMAVAGRSAPACCIMAPRQQIQRTCTTREHY